MAIQLWNRAERLKPEPPTALAAPPPPKAAAQPAPEGRPYKGASDGLKTGMKPMSFCGADMLISEPDGSVSVKHGPGCTCPKEGP